MSPVEGGIQVVEGICAEKRKNLDTFWAMADQKNASTFGGSGSREVHLTKYFWGGRCPKIIRVFVFFSAHVPSTSTATPSRCSKWMGGVEVKGRMLKNAKIRILPLT